MNKRIDPIPSSLMIRRVAARILVGMALLAVIAGRMPVHAGSITVNTTSMAVANDGKCTLGEAIIAANNDTASGNKPGECPAGHGPDTIILSSSTYTLTEVLEALEDPMGLPFVVSDITIEGHGATIVRDSQAPEFGMIGVAFDTGKLTMNNLTIRGGRTSGEATAPGLGVFVGAVATLTQVTLIDNISDHPGTSWTGDGSVYVSDASLTLIDSSVQNDTGAHAYGMLLFNTILTLQNSVVSAHTEEGIVAYDSTLNFIGARIEDNGGRGVQLRDSVIAVAGSTIRQNNNGGMELRGSRMEMTDSMVSDNHVPRDFGNLAAGLAIRTSSAVTLTRTSIIGNDEPGDTPPCPCVIGEDGIRVLDSSLTVIDSLIADDRNPESMDNSLHFDGNDLRIINSTITGSGSAPLRVDKASQVEIDFSTIVSDFDYSLNPTAFANSGSQLGAVHIRNSLIEGCWQSVGNGSDGYNLEPDTHCGFTATGDQQHIDFDTLLDPLADNGGPSQTHALLPGAPAIDAIPNGVNGCQAGISSDQRGAPRAGGTNQGGSACDSGAYESGSVVLTPTPTSTPTRSPTSTLTPTSTRSPAATSTPTPTPTTPAAQMLHYLPLIFHTSGS